MAYSVWNRSLDPWNGIARDLDQIFTTLPLRREGYRSTPNNLSVAYDIEEVGDHYVLTFEVPGVAKDDLNIEVIGNRLVVSGERKAESQSVRQRYGKFQHSFELPDGVGADAVEADLRHGVLKVLIHKPAPVTAKKISISDGSDKAEGFLKSMFRDKKTHDTSGLPTDHTGAPSASSNV